MVRTIKDVVVSLLILTIPVTAWSKGEIIKIEIEGNNLSSPIEITDPDIVRQFSIWTGPGVSTRGSDDAQDTLAVNLSTISVQEYFTEKLREGVIDRVGQPIEGFVPFMFMQAFSGLVLKDFDGADALLGEYKIVDKELAFIMNEGGPIHSAAEAVSEEGMKTVFANIQRRRNMLIATTDEVDGLLLYLGAPLDLSVSECLPEQRVVDACIEIYQPVCATVKVQCVTTPCDPVQETFANSCKACKNSLVSSYTNGECTVDQ